MVHIGELSVPDSHPLIAVGGSICGRSLQDNCCRGPSVADTLVRGPQAGFQAAQGPGCDTVLPVAWAEGFCCWSHACASWAEIHQSYRAPAALGATHPDCHASACAGVMHLGCHASAVEVGMHLGRHFCVSWVGMHLRYHASAFVAVMHLEYHASAASCGAGMCPSGLRCAHFGPLLR
jgi:hypothetical protein